MQIIYEPHPVSPQRKRELIAKGYRILDARFAPVDYVHPEAKHVEVDRPRLGRPRKAGE